MSRSTPAGRTYRNFRRGIERYHDFPDKTRTEVIAFLVQANSHFWTVYMFKDGNDSDP